MRDYELIYIIKPNLDEEATSAVVEKFTNLITNNGGQIDKNDRWGKRKLAYEVNDYREGYYTLVNFKGEAKVAQELERVLKITDDVIKHLLVRKED